MFICKWCKEKVFEEKPDVDALEAGDVVNCPECGKFLYGKSAFGKPISRVGGPVLNIEHHTLVHDKTRMLELGPEEVERRLTPTVVYASEVAKLSGQKAKNMKKPRRKYIRSKVLADNGGDPVNNPPHYKRGGLEAIDVIEAWDLPFALGNVVKYICRTGHKENENGVTDLEKAKCYLDRHLKVMAKKGA